MWLYTCIYLLYMFFLRWNVQSPTLKILAWQARIIFVAQRPISGLGCLIVEVYTLHSHTHTHKHRHTHTHTHKIGILWTNDDLAAKAATYTTHNSTKGRASMPPMGFERPLQQSAAADLPLRPHGHTDRRHFYYTAIYERESNENLKSAIKIRNTAHLSCKLTTMILMVWRVADRWQYDAGIQHDGAVVV
jgi:hypothetical protein